MSLTRQRFPQQPAPQQPLPPALMAEQLGHNICNIKERKKKNKIK